MHSRTIIASAVIHILWAIWLRRNSLRFINKALYFQHLIATIRVEIALPAPRTSFSSTPDLITHQLQQLIQVEPSFCLRQIKAVCWLLRHVGYIKYNTGGGSHGIPRKAACEGLFKMRRVTSWEVSLNIFILGAYHAELIAVEHAHNMGSFCLWLETDSLLVLKCFQDDSECSFRSPFIPEEMLTPISWCVLLFNPNHPSPGGIASLEFNRQLWHNLLSVL